jgi:hypothetical protein
MTDNGDNGEHRGGDRDLLDRLFDLVPLVAVLLLVFVFANLAVSYRNTSVAGRGAKSRIESPQAAPSYPRP